MLNDAYVHSNLYTWESLSWDNKILKTVYDFLDARVAEVANVLADPHTFIINSVITRALCPVLMAKDITPVL
jgi:hypothetical protein